MRSRPKIFDNITRENGVPTRTFNFGIDGMNPPENFYVLEQILKTEPRSLKWIFVEVDNIRNQIAPSRFSAPNASSTGTIGPARR